MVCEVSTASRVIHNSDDKSVVAFREIPIVNLHLKITYREHIIYIDDKGLVIINHLAGIIITLGPHLHTSYTHIGLSLTGVFAKCLALC